MGCVSSSESTGTGLSYGESANAVEVEYELMQARMKELFKFKVLVLGAGESGKSTIVKALTLIHKGKSELTTEEKNRVVCTLFENVITCMKALLEGGEMLGIRVQDPVLSRIANDIVSLDPNVLNSGKFALSPEMSSDILQLWHSPVIQSIYARRTEYWILDSCNYLMDNLDRFISEDYYPSEDDMLMARVRTTGIVSNDFHMKRADVEEGEPDTVLYQIVDVGGQRNERRKWIHCFDDVKAIIFTVSLAGYNQILFEDHTKKRISEDLDLFASICNRDTFKNTPIFLWLNKKDLFEKMVQSHDFAENYPDFKGDTDLMSALHFVTDLFKQKAPGRDFSTQYVSARVKKDIQYAFEDVKRSLYQGNKKLIDEEKNQLKQVERKLRYKKQNLTAK